MPTFPEAAAETYPLVVTVFIFIAFLMLGFGGIARFAINAFKDIANNFVKSLEKIVDRQDTQTKLLLEIHDAVTEESKGTTKTGKRGV